MSRGPGRIERAIEAALAAEPGNALTTDDLCDRVYRGVNRIERKHRVAVVRGGKRLLARRRTSISAMYAETLGRTLIFYDPCCLASYAMARLKSIGYGYRSNDYRELNSATETDLRAMLDPGDCYHRNVIPGGAWWLHVEQAIARRDGAQERMRELEVVEAQMYAAILAGAR